MDWLDFIEANRLIRPRRPDAEFDDGEMVAEFDALRRAARPCRRRPVREWLCRRLGKPDWACLDPRPCVSRERNRRP